MTQAKPAAKKSKRIVAFDVLRGYFLLVILINHIELYPSGFDYFTGRGRLFVSAAEGFFFMSGLLVGMVYRRRLHLGLKFIFKKMWTRAATLYLGSVVLTLIFTVAAVHFNHGSIKQGLWYPVTDWWSVIAHDLTLSYSFGWADFLDRFALMMAAAPFGIYLLSRGKWWLLGLISIAVWAGPGNNNPGDTLNWQIIFMFAMIIGYYWNSLTARWRRVSSDRRRLIKRWVIALSSISFAYSYTSVYILSVLNERLMHLPLGWQRFTLDWNSFNGWIWQYAQKWTVGPLRIVLFGLWFWCLFMLANRYYQPITRFTKGTVEMIGQNSLFVYVIHAFIVFIFKLFIPSQTSFGENFAITAAALALLVSVTKLYVHHRPKLSAHKASLTQRLPWIPANIES